MAPRGVGAARCRRDWQVRLGVFRGAAGHCGAEIPVFWFAADVVQGEINPTKTEASQKSVPLGRELVESLLRLKSRTFYHTETDYVFAGDNGKTRWQGILLADHIKPAAVRAGIGKIGWHTLRHTYSTLLHELGALLAVQKELLRHSDIQTTMNVYTQAVSATKRRAAEKAQSILLGKKKTG